MRNAEIYIRNKKTSKKVNITDDNKPEIDDLMVEKWQKIINLVAEIFNVPAGLIMKITKGSMKVYLKSSNSSNPYKVGEEGCLGTGLYCETVIGNDSELLVANALEDEQWKYNPDVELNMISYYGLPIHWPDQSFFGTICVLDDTYNDYTEQFKRLLKSFKEVIEDDLKLLMSQQQLNYLANKDYLTGAYNREAMVRFMEEELKRSQRTKVYFSIVLIDIDEFSRLNQLVGYSIGDLILVDFVNLIEREVRTIDSVGRWAGDELIVLCPNTNETGAKKIVTKLDKIIEAHEFHDKHHLTCSFGVSTYMSTNDTVEYLISQANRHLEKEKKKVMKD